MQRCFQVEEPLKPPKERLTKAQVEEKAVGVLKAFDRFPKDKLDQVTLRLLSLPRLSCQRGQGVWVER